MRKDVTEADKIELFKNFYTDEVQLEIEKAVKTPRKFFLPTVIALPCISIALGFINPWFLLTLLLSFSTPFAFSAIETKRLNKIVAKIAPGFTYSDIINMMETNEWRRIAIKVRSEENAATAKTTSENPTTPIPVKNTTRSLNVCIINDEENNASVDSDI